MILFALFVLFLCLLAYAAGFLVSRTTGPESVEACRIKINAANDKTRAAEASAQMWRQRALQAEQSVSQRDQDMTASTTMLLEELDRARGVTR